MEEKIMELTFNMRMLGVAFIFMSLVAGVLAADRWRLIARNREIAVTTTPIRRATNPKITMPMRPLDKIIADTPAIIIKIPRNTYHLYKEQLS